MFKLYFTYLYQYIYLIYIVICNLFIHLFICNLLLTAVPIISERLDKHLLFEGGNGLYVNVDC